jgi:hypothetical protein
MPQVRDTLLVNELGNSFYGYFCICYNCVWVWVQVRAYLDIDVSSCKMALSNNRKLDILLWQAGSLIRLSVFLSLQWLQWLHLLG